MGTLSAVTCAAAVLMFGGEVLLYTLLLPRPDDEPVCYSPVDALAGRVLYRTAQVLSPLRLPLGLIPYLIKLVAFFIFGRSYKILEQKYSHQALHIAGDFANFAIMTAIVFQLAGPPRVFSPAILLYAPLVAELVRLLGERGQMIFSGIWMILPHRRIADALIWRHFPSAFQRMFASYRAYYLLDAHARCTYVQSALMHRAAADTDLMSKLRYFHGFTLVSSKNRVRGGLVRSVHTGQVLINPLWTSDPWLLIGLAIRRSPWMFDPRILQRPFYYRTQSARLATRVVLLRARHCLPYIVYQFGHEIKDARYGQFYALLHHLHLHIEEHVLADGTYRQDHLFRWLERRFRHQTADNICRPLWEDSEVIRDVHYRAQRGEVMSPQEITSRYVYPSEYVEDVLLDLIAGRKGTYARTIGLTRVGSNADYREIFTADGFSGAASESCME